MFMAMPIVLFPAFATEVLKEPKLLGLPLQRGGGRRDARHA